MSDTEQACEATPFAELERQMMDTNIPKNEREWWAWREICNLRAEVERLRAAIGQALYELETPSSLRMAREILSAALTQEPSHDR